MNKFSFVLNSLSSIWDEFYIGVFLGGLFLVWSRVMPRWVSKTGVKLLGVQKVFPACEAVAQ
jgi:hypothetical protein